MKSDREQGNKYIKREGEVTAHGLHYGAWAEPKMRPPINAGSF